jgi:prepilin-type N-terminal cleavage/methylation domain-containing protein
MAVNKKNNRGFSIAELMIVVAVVGILSFIGLQNYEHYMRKVRQKEAFMMLGSARTALETFYAEWNSYTSDFYGAGVRYNGLIQTHISVSNVAFDAPTYIGVTPLVSAVYSTRIADVRRNTTNGARVCAPTGHTAMLQHSYTMATCSYLSGGTWSVTMGTDVPDRWTQNESGVRTNTSDGLVD